MTEYWVSQGNKWCDFCKIFISNNPASIRNHELGKRHKDSVANKLDDMRKASAAKDKEHKEALRTIEQIEAKAKRSYQKDIATFQENSNNHALDVKEDGQEKWEYDDSSGYYCNQSNGLYYDPKSGFYYSDGIGKWVTQEEAYAAVLVSSDSKQKGVSTKKPLFASSGGPASAKNASKVQTGPSPGPVVSASLNPLRTYKGAATSSLAVNKRKRSNEKPKVISEEEKAALKAREAAKKRVEDREKALLGLYKH